MINNGSRGSLANAHQAGANQAPMTSYRIILICLSFANCDELFKLQLPSLIVLV